MKYRMFIFTSILLFSINASASCEIWQEGSTNWQACLKDEKRKNIKEKLNQAQKKLIENYTSLNILSWVEILNESQDNWKKQMETICEREQREFGGIGHITQIECELRLSKLRLSKIEKML